jgi:hypothetical protein
MAEAPKLTFFTVCDGAYFVGLVALLNSLRLLGHHDPVVVGDCGLRREQRDVLAGHCTLLPLAREMVVNPIQFKPFANLCHPEGLVVVIDSDMIVTRHLGALIEAAAKGQIALFPDPEQDRWFREWQEIFALPRPPRRQTYVCSGLIAFSAAHWPDFLSEWWTACSLISSHSTYQEKSGDTPTAQGDQDALNALLMTVYPSTALAIQPREEQVFRWDFRNHVELKDSATLRCRSRSHDAVVLHACLAPKPWQRSGFRHNVYTRLLRRLLHGPDVAITVPPEMLPIWLREGAKAAAARTILSIANMTNPDDGALPDFAVSLGRRAKSHWRAMSQGWQAAS